MPTISSADGTSIAFETVGHGPPLVLVDGAMCFRDSGPLRAIARAISGRLTAVLYDRRGRGASGDAVHSTVANEIEDLDALIGAVGGSAAVLGVSSGGALALAAAAALGAERVTALAVYEVPYMPEPALPAAAQYTAALTAALAEDRRDDAVAEFLRRAGMPDGAIAGVRHSPGWAGMVALAPTLAYDDAAMGDSSVPLEIAGALSIPTLTLAGGASPDVLQYGASALADEVSGAVFEIVEGQGHDLDAGAVAPHLLRFFAA